MEGARVCDFFYYESKSKIDNKKKLGGDGAGVSEFFYYESKFKIEIFCVSVGGG